MRKASSRFASLSRALGSSVLAALALSGCTHTPDPCADYALACIAVTVEDGPPKAAQLLVRVLDGYGSSTPNTPRRVTDKPLVYPLRFAIRFEEFDFMHRGKVTVELTAIDRASETLGQVQREVAIDGFDKVALSLRIGAPFDMTADLSSPPVSPPDLVPHAPADMATADQSMPPDGSP